ncbi:MAG: septal ring lytic transglycosylase RlpA family protein [Proteobacteria bacterium]|nr:septal ring lytic transglycosylase RlpA family protein [Pseudomonadota bacterium]
MPAPLLSALQFFARQNGALPRVRRQLTTLFRTDPAAAGVGGRGRTPGKQKAGTRERTPCLAVSLPQKCSSHFWSAGSDQAPPALANRKPVAYHLFTLLFVLFSALFLSSCSEIYVANHLWKKSEGLGCKAVGDSKVGSPYMIDGTRYQPLSSSVGYDEKGIASWYGSDFHGKATANGECYNMYAFTAAHRTLPMPTIARVTNLENGKSVVVKVNDRGPYARGRIIDLSYAAAQSLGMIGNGTAPVEVQAIGGAFHGSDSMLALRNNNAPTAEQPETLPTVVPETASEEDLAPLTQADLQKEAQRQQAETEKERALGVPAPSASLPAPPPFEKRQFTDTAPLKKTRVYVQIGAFAEEPRAVTQQLQLAKLYKTAHISAIDVAGKHLLRVRAGPFRSVADADAALQNVTTNGFPDAQIKVDE